MSDSEKSKAQPHRIKVNGIALVIKDATPIGEQILQKAKLVPADDYLLIQRESDDALEEISPQEPVELNEGETEFYAFKADRAFYFALNERRYPWTDQVAESFLREIGSIADGDDIWLERQDEADQKIARGVSVSLTGSGTERFYSRPPETWTLDVQGVEITSSKPSIVVSDAIRQAGFDPNQGWIVVLRVQGQPKQQVELDTAIDLRTPGIERLRLVPKEIQNGEAPLSQRRDFRLLPKDEAYLDTRGFSWETAQDGGRRWLLLRGVALPPGFNHAHTDIAIDIPTLYPQAMLDMFYCHPALARSSGQAIPQTEVTELVVGRPFQRWSRHWPPGAWNPMKDSVISQVGLFETCLEREVEA